MSGLLKADPVGWTSEGTANCWFARKYSPAERKIIALGEENRMLMKVAEQLSERLSVLERGKNHESDAG